jgi:rhodanese-related sulfurtransferase
MESSTSPNSRTSKFEWLVNVAIIFVAAYLIFTLARTYLPWGRHEQVVPVKTGAHLVLPDVEWSGKGQTLVMALSTECHFCSESAPFYQRLVRDLTTKGGVRVVAVLPQTVEEGREYMRKLGVTVGEVRQLDLASLGLQGTPTLILADGTGIVSDVWTGKLMTQQEHALYQRLQLEDSAAADEFISASDLKRMLKDKNLLVVDVDNRDLFRVNHIPGALNIPLDELEVRASDELSSEKRIVVYCHVCEQDTDSDMAHGILRKNGFNQVSILKGGLKAWEAEKPQGDLNDQTSGAADKKAAAAKR